MKPKKNHSANLERRRAVHIQIGLLVAMSFILVSLEWTSPDNSTSEQFAMIFISDLEPDIVPIVPRDEKPKPKVQLPQVMIPVDVDDLDIDDLDDPIFVNEYTGQTVDIYVPDLPVEEIVEPVNRDFVEIRAEFPGGDAALMKWVYSNISYPEECIEHGIEGRVTAKFIVNKFGEVRQVEIASGAHPKLDEEVLRVLNMIPDFRPAMQNGQLVPVFMYWPVVFDLR